MVALILEQAEAVRAEAQRLRAEERRLRERLAAARARQRRLLAGVLDHARHGAELRQRPRPSPWSALEWRSPDGDELGGVLVALD